jgi:hypothetical protein
MPFFLWFATYTFPRENPIPTKVSISPDIFLVVTFKSESKRMREKKVKESGRKANDSKAAVYR